MRTDPLAAPAPRSAFTGGNILSGSRVTSSAGNLLLGPIPGSSLAAGALFIELPGPGRACWISSSCSLAELGLELAVSRQKRHPKDAGTSAPDVDVMGASCVTSDQVKLAGSADRLAAAGGRQLAVNVSEVRLDRVDGDVHFSGGLSAAEHA